MSTLGTVCADVRLLLWLRIRHARWAVNRIMHLFGCGIDEGGWAERAYQLYALALMAVWAVLMWAALLDAVSGAFALMGAAAVVDALRWTLAACVLVLVGAGVQGLRTSPLKLTHPDIALVAASSISTQALVLVAAVLQAFGAGLVAAALGFLLGVGLESAGASAFFGVGVTGAVWSALALSMLVAAACLSGWIAGMVRLACPYWRLRHALAAGGALALVANGWGVFVLGVAPETLVAPGFFAALAAVAPVVLFAGAALLSVCALRVDMTAVIKENALFADLQVIGVFSPLDDRTKADFRRRRKLAARPVRFNLPPGEGRLALVARSMLSHARQYDGLLALIVHGGVVVPLGVSAILGVGGPVLFLFWLQLAVLMPQGARELSRVFRDDERNRLVRDRLPFGVLELLVFDSLPAFVVTTLIAGIVCVLVVPTGVSVLAAVALAAVVNSCTLFACGLDAVRLFPGGPRPCYEFGAIAMVAVAFALSLFAPWLAVAAGIALTAAICALIVRFGTECAR